MALCWKGVGCHAACLMISHISFCTASPNLAHAFSELIVLFVIGILGRG